ncbi:MAG: hypothetical protein JST92_25000, partial [Deltaproteobacteria bacterium]|nr:hypothetical protein [Deltaproteobacteria bacterium]
MIRSASPLAQAALGLLALSLVACGGTEIPPATKLAPPAPEQVQATGGDGQITLSWSASANATSYEVRRSSASAGPFGAVG